MKRTQCKTELWHQSKKEEGREILLVGLREYSRGEGEEKEGETMMEEGGRERKDENIFEITK